MSFEALDDLYRDVIVDHFKNPRHHGSIDPFDVEQEGYNPLCGDHIFLRIKCEDGKISNIGFTGKGCTISQAAASILTDEAIGKSIEEAEKKILFFKEMMQGKKDPTEEDGDLEALWGVKKFPVRIKCALLAWTTLQEAIGFYKNKEGSHVD